jgi:hypothetical protein
LGDLGKLGETLGNDPLLLALTDAMVRAEDELARAEDRLARPENAELHPREEVRLQRLLRRSDTLGFAYTGVSGGTTLILRPQLCRFSRRCERRRTSNSTATSKRSASPTELCS